MIVLGSRLGWCISWAGDSSSESKVQQLLVNEALCKVLCRSVGIVFHSTSQPKLRIRILSSKFRGFLAPSKLPLRFGY